jgi:hypothetical protein
VNERTTQQSVRPVRASDSPLLFRPTTSPSGPGLTVPGESDDQRDGSGIGGSILALCKRPIRTCGSVR